MPQRGSAGTIDVTRPGSKKMGPAGKTVLKRILAMTLLERGNVLSFG